MKRNAHTEEDLMVMTALKSEDRITTSGQPTTGAQDVDLWAGVPPELSRAPELWRFLAPANRATIAVLALDLLITDPELPGEDFRRELRAAVGARCAGTHDEGERRRLMDLADQLTALDAPERRLLADEFSDLCVRLRGLIAVAGTYSHITARAAELRPLAPSKRLMTGDAAAVGRR